MKKLALVLMAIICCLGFIGSACAEGLQCGETVYVRSNLHVDGNTVYWHNMSVYPCLIPVGTPVQITRSVGDRINFVVLDTNRSYRVTNNCNFWDKFFVRNPGEIGLNRQKAAIENGEILMGMTKQEVYASRGCPAFAEWGKTTERLSLAEIMQSDKWYYNTNSRGHDVMVTFQNGTVVKTGGFEK